jgi:two-component system, LytTR family, response regulator
MMIRALIIDDEKLARLRLRRMLSDHQEVEIAGEAKDGREALRLIHTLRPDVLFLDIRMPLLSGFELLRELKPSPIVVFTTAYDEYALKAFEENTVDYLLKPIDKDKLDRAVSKLLKIFHGGSPIRVDMEKLIRSLEQKERMIKRFSVKTGNRFLIVPEDRITYFEAEDKYTFLHTEDGEHIVSFTLRELETRLDPDKFLRVNRSCLVNLEAVSSIHAWFGGRLLLKIKGGKEVIISRMYTGDFKKKIHLS